MTVASSAALTDLLAGLQLLCEPDAVHELRVPKAGRARVISGYFDDPEAMARAAEKLSGRFPGIYFTANPVQPSLLARARNRVVEHAEITTSDNDIARRRWLILDLDPDRPAGISASDQEHEAAIQRARDINAFLTHQGWPKPIAMDSGNGCYLLYRIELPNTDQSRRLIEGCLKALAVQFDDDQVHVDQTMYNAARIIRVPGTLNAKGDDTPERPYRMSSLLFAPKSVATVPEELLKARAGKAPEGAGPESQNGQNGHRIYVSKDFDLAGFVRDHLDVFREGVWSGNGYRWVLRVCPFSSDHAAGEAYVVRKADGTIAAGCQHNSCGWKWQELREKFEPGSKERRKQARSREEQSGTPGTEGPQAERGQLPKIVISGYLPGMTAEALAALSAANCPPHLFTRGLELSRIVDDDEQRPCIQGLDVHALRGELARVANWISVDKEGKRRPAHPPIPVIQDVRTLPDRGEGFPPLAGIIEAPALRPDGTLIVEPGYDASTRLWYRPDPEIKVPEIPDRPSKAEVSAARDRIEDAIGQFPFVDAAAHANAYALLLTPVVRPAIPGPVPLALLDAPQQGTGKTLFAGVAALVATGRAVATRSAPVTEEEWRKCLATMLRAGAGFVMFDNIRLEDWRGEYQPLESAALAAVLTAWPSYTDRVLGSSVEGRWSVRQTWVASGNNLVVSGDLMRRCYRVRLDAESPRPWQGRRFRHPQLLSYVHERRGELLAALLTMARAWFAEGRPTVGTPDLASFESWTQVVGGILAHAGIPGFLGDLAAFYSEIDEASAEWSGFLARWLTLWPTGAEPECSRWQTTRELIAAMPAHQGDLRAVLPAALIQIADSERSVDLKLAKALKRRVGVRVDDRGLRLERSDDPHTKVALWRAVTG